jgi:hypothetical protein
MSGLLFLLKRLQQSVIESERTNFLKEVYSDECVVSCVFQLLGDMEKTFVLRMLLLDRPLREQLFKFWTIPPPVGMNPKMIYDPPLETLTSLGILNVLNSPVEEASYDLNAAFRSSLVSAISRSTLEPVRSTVWTFSQQSSQLHGDETKWHSLLERIISTNPSRTEALSDTDRVVLRLGFGNEPRPPAAYKFVLADVTTQLWTLINEFAALIERERGNLLGMSELIQTIAGIMTAVSISPHLLLSLDPEAGLIAKRTVTFLSDMDAIRSPTEKNPFQKPVHWLGPAAGALHKSIKEDLLLGAKLIVDSNMHVMAYTRSNLQRQLIGMFCEVHRHIGTLMMGVLTRKSVQGAIDSGGVSSDSIIRFLSSNLHSSCGTKLPNNVSLQIRLWEADCPRNRMRMEPCVTVSWRADRTEQGNSAIAQLKKLAEAQRGLLFYKQEPDGRIHIGIKSDIARSLLTR